MSSAVHTFLHPILNHTRTLLFAGLIHLAPQNLTAENGGTIPETQQLQADKAGLEADLDTLGGEDPAVIAKYEKAKAEVSFRTRRKAREGRERKERTAEPLVPGKLTPLSILPYVVVDPTSRAGSQRARGAGEEAEQGHQDRQGSSRLSSLLPSVVDPFTDVYPIFFCRRSGSPSFRSSSLTSTRSSRLRWTVSPLPFSAFRLVDLTPFPFSSFSPRRPRRDPPQGAQWFVFPNSPSSSRCVSLISIAHTPQTTPSGPSRSSSRSERPTRCSS